MQPGLAYSLARHAERCHSRRLFGPVKVPIQLCQSCAVPPAGGGILGGFSNAGQASKGTGTGGLPQTATKAAKLKAKKKKNKFERQRRCVFAQTQVARADGKEGTKG